MFLTYLLIPSPMPIALAAFLIDLNLEGSMPSEKTSNAFLLTKSLKLNLFFKCAILPSVRSFSLYKLIELPMIDWFKIIHFRRGMEIPKAFKWFKFNSHLCLKPPCACMPVYSCHSFERLSCRELRYKSHTSSCHTNLELAFGLH